MRPSTDTSQYSRFIFVPRTFCNIIPCRAWADIGTQSCSHEKRNTLRLIQSDLLVAPGAESIPSDFSHISRLLVMATTQGGIENDTPVYLLGFVSLDKES